MLPETSLTRLLSKKSVQVNFAFNASLRLGQNLRISLKTLVLPGLEPGTFRVLGERDNHYTTESWLWDDYNGLSIVNSQTYVT